MLICFHTPTFNDLDTVLISVNHFIVFPFIVLQKDNKPNCITFNSLLVKLFDLSSSFYVQ